jgi:deoxyadenosine/deoxycytidine kinase
MACNGFKAIIIKCDCIPEELKNTLLYPHLKKNFPEEAIVNIENKYPPLEKFFPQPKDYQHSFFSFNAETFYKRFTVTRNTVTFNGVNADCLEIGTRTIFFDSKLLREAIEAIEAFNDEEFAVHVANWKVLPLFLDNSKRKICVMPLRIVTDEEAFYSE